MDPGLAIEAFDVAENWVLPYNGNQVPYPFEVGCHLGFCVTAGGCKIGTAQYLKCTWFFTKRLIGLGCG